MTTLLRACLFLTIAVALIGCSALFHSPCVRIGSTQAEIHQGIENEKAGLNLNPGGNLDPKFRVSAGFEKGVCNRIKYIPVDKGIISDHSVSVLLSNNSKGVAWITRGDSTPERTTYLTIDGKYRAILTNKKELFIVTEKLWQKSMSELAAEKQKSQAPVPFQP
jgi:hypothetical protein